MGRKLALVASLTVVAIVVLVVVAALIFAALYLLGVFERPPDRALQ